MVGAPAFPGMVSLSRRTVAAKLGPPGLAVRPPLTRLSTDLTSQRPACTAHLEREPVETGLLGRHTRTAACLPEEACGVVLDKR